MNEETARMVGKVFRGEAYQSGGNIWCVRLRKKSGTFVVISDTVIAEFATSYSLDKGEDPINQIELYA